MWAQETYENWLNKYCHVACTQKKLKRFSLWQKKNIDSNWNRLPSRPFFQYRKSFVTQFGKRKQRKFVTIKQRWIVLSPRSYSNRLFSRAWYWSAKKFGQKRYSVSTMYTVQNWVLQFCCSLFHWIFCVVRFCLSHLKCIFLYQFIHFIHNFVMFDAKLSWIRRCT